MQRSPGYSARLLSCLAAMLLLTACGSGKSSARLPAAGDPDPIDDTPPAPAAIQGVATPSTVSVVTATNAD